MTWETKKLEDIVSIRTGKLDSNAAVVGGLYPFFTCDPQTLAINDWAYDTEAVLLAGNNASGNYTAKYYKGRFNAYQRVYIIEALDEKMLDIRYLSYTLNQQLQLLKTMSSGSTTKFLTKAMLKPLSIDYPPIATQHRIASILSAYDDLIENNRRQIQLLEEAAQRLYREWFVELRFPGHEDVKIVDGVPEGWRKKPFSQLVTIMSGGTPKTDNKAYYGGHIPFYTPKDSDGAFFSYSTQTHITDEGLNNCHSPLYPEGTIVITARGTVGKTTILGVPMAMNQSCYALKCEQYSMPYYLFFSLNEEVRKLKAMANGGVFNTIIVKTFDNISMFEPESSVVSHFNELVST